MRNYRTHGLRKAACKALAHAGCTGPEIVAVSGHATLAQVQVYIDEVEQEQMAEATMQKLPAAEGKSEIQTYKPRPIPPNQRLDRWDI